MPQLCSIYESLAHTAVQQDAGHQEEKLSATASIGLVSGFKHCPQTSAEGKTQLVSHLVRNLNGRRGRGRWPLWQRSRHMAPPVGTAPLLHHVGCATAGGAVGASCALRWSGVLAARLLQPSLSSHLLASASSLGMRPSCMRSLPTCAGSSIPASRQTARMPWWCGPWPVGRVKNNPSGDTTGPHGVPTRACATRPHMRPTSRAHAENMRICATWLYARPYPIFFSFNEPFCKQLPRRSEQHGGGRNPQIHWQGPSGHAAAKRRTSDESARRLLIRGRLPSTLPVPARGSPRRLAANACAAVMDKMADQ